MEEKSFNFRLKLMQSFGEDNPETPPLTEFEKQIIRDYQLVNVKIFKHKVATFAAYKHPTLDGYGFTRQTGRRFIKFLIDTDPTTLGFLKTFVDLMRKKEATKACMTLTLMGTLPLTEEGFALVSFFAIHYLPGDIVEWAKTEVFQRVDQAVDKYLEITSLSQNAENN